MQNMPDKHDEFDDIGLIDRLAAAAGKTRNLFSGLNFPLLGKLGGFVVVIIFLIAVLSGLFQGKTGTDKDLEIANLPVLEPASGSFRVRPEDRGGMEIPHQDSALYQALSDETTKPDGLGIADNTAKTAISPSEPSAEKPQKKPGKAQQGGTDPSTDPDFGESKHFAGLEKALKQKFGDDVSHPDNFPETQKTTPVKPPVTPERKVENLAYLSPREQVSDQADTKPATRKKDRKQESNKATQVNTQAEAPVENQTQPPVESQAAPPIENQAKTKSKKAGTETKVTQQNDPGDSQAPLNRIIDPVLKQGASQDSTVPEKKPETETGPGSETDNQAQDTSPEVTDEITEDEKTEKGSLVQVGSMTSQDRAEEEWSRLSSRYSDILKDRPYRIEKADLGEKGVFYRLQAGPFTRQVAQTICGELKKAGKKGGCLVVAR